MSAAEQKEHALLDAIRRGKAPKIIRRRAARGTLSVSADELLEILVFLSQDSDPTLSETAQQTLAGWTPEKCAPLLIEPHISANTLAHFAALPGLPDSLMATLASHPNSDDRTLAALAGRLPLAQVKKIAADEDRLASLSGFVAAVLKRKDLPTNLRTRFEAQAGPKNTAPAAQQPETEEKVRIGIMQQINQMGVAEKIAYTVKASREAILILIRDPAKLVYRAVLTSPKLGDSEAETIASMKNVSDQVLRMLASNRKFAKNRVVARNLVSNPRTPIAVALTLMKKLSPNELKVIATNRSVPDTVRITAGRMFKARHP